MSIPSVKEYIRTQQLNWERKKRLGLANRKRRSKLITDVADVLQCSREWANRLLTGSVVHKGRKGRGKTYRDAEIEVIRALWRELGGPCAPYLHAGLGRFLRDYRVLHHVPQEVAERVLRMSASTIARAIRGQDRPNSVWAKPRNKRSGKNAIRALVPIESGEDRPAHEIPREEAQRRGKKEKGIGGWWGSAPRPGRAKFALHPRHVLRTCLPGTRPAALRRFRRFTRFRSAPAGRRTRPPAKLPSLQTSKLRFPCTVLRCVPQTSPDTSAPRPPKIPLGNPKGSEAKP